VLGLVLARRGDAGAGSPLDEADALARSTGDVMRIAPVAAARAEAAWLDGDHAAVKRVTDTALTLALQRRARWITGELAYWRWQAGLRDGLPAGAAAEPYSLAIRGDWAGAAERWREIGCPYETALALARAADEPAVRRSIDELRRLGAHPAAGIVARRLRELGGAAG
jgi:hypothetical protein